MNLVVQGTGFVVKLSSSDQLVQTERPNQDRPVGGRLRAFKQAESLGARSPAADEPGTEEDIEVL